MVWFSSSHASFLQIHCDNGEEFVSKLMEAETTSNRTRGTKMAVRPHGTKRSLEASEEGEEGKQGDLQSIMQSIINDLNHTPCVELYGCITPFVALHGTTQATVYSASKE